MTCGNPRNLCETQGSDCWQLTHLNALKGIVWGKETWSITTLNIPKCEHFTSKIDKNYSFLECSSWFLAFSIVFFQACFAIIVTPVNRINREYKVSPLTLLLEAFPIDTFRSSYRKIFQSYLAFFSRFYIFFPGNLNLTIASN